MAVTSTQDPPTTSASAPSITMISAHAPQATESRPQNLAHPSRREYSLVLGPKTNPKRARDPFTPPDPHSRYTRPLNRHVTVFTPSQASQTGQLRKTIRFLQQVDLIRLPVALPFDNAHRAQCGAALIALPHAHIQVKLLTQ